MKTWAVVSLLLVAPFVAAAQPAPGAGSPEAGPAAAAPAAELPRWSLGAGVGWGTSYLVLPGRSSFDYLPIATASLERAVGARTWLVVDLSGALDRDAYAGLGSERDYSLVYLAAGVRRVLTPAGSPVDVSAIVVLEGGFEDRHEEGIFAEDYESTAVGIAAGFAVERKLLDRLAVRLATHVASARWRRFDAAGPTATAEGDAFTARLSLSPRIELRLYF